MALNITELIQHPEKLSDRLVLDELSALLQEYPYYQTARLLYLKGLYLLRDATFGEELQKTAFYVSDRKILFYLIEGEHYAMNPVGRKVGERKGDSIATDRTLTLIDAFLNGLPAEVEEERRDKVAIVDDGGLSSDYTSYILRDDDLRYANEDRGASPRMKGEDLIDEFIKKTDTRIPVDWESANPEGPELVDYDEDDDSCFTETLAKIYIKQHRYAKAIEIIQRLSLKYPKKSAYFADQIRTLEKLVINSNDK